MTTDFIVNPRDPAIVDVWLGDVFLGELHATATGFRILTPGTIALESGEPPPEFHNEAFRPRRPLRSVDVIITPEV